MALIGLLVSVVVLLELWEHPVGWLHGPRQVVVATLHWIRAHWRPTAGAVAVAATLLGYVLQRRREHQQDRREQERQEAARAALLAAHCWIDEATGWLPQVGQATNLVQLGVHPAAHLDELIPQGPPLDLPAGVPVYVPRDVDAKLDAALAGGGLVLLVGDSTAGKSRAAYEAMKRLLAERWLLVPHHRESLRALLDAGFEFSDAVVWLNDLDRYLGPGGFDVPLLRRLVGDSTRRVVVLATMRSSEYGSRSPERGRRRAGPERDLLQAERELLDQATRLDLARHLSESERERAQERSWDPRIADALTHTGQYGLAEYIAAGPVLWHRWRDGFAVDNPDERLAGAAIVAAAVDCRRAGLTGSVPEVALREMYDTYLERSVAQRLQPEAFEAGLKWASEPVQATTALLEPHEGGYIAFDYLVDAMQPDPDSRSIPERTWERLLASLPADAAWAVGRTAYRAGKRELAGQAFQVGFGSRNRTIMGQAAFGLAFLAYEREDWSDAEILSRQSAGAGSDDGAALLGSLLVQRQRFEEAEPWLRKAAGASNPIPLVQVLLAAQLHSRGDLDEAEAWSRKAAEANNSDAQVLLGLILRQRGDIAGAEPVLRGAIEAGKRPKSLLGKHHAEHALALLLLQRGELEQAEAWARQAAEAGNTNGQALLGAILFQRRATAEAEMWFRRAAEAGNHPAEYTLGLLLQQRGEPKEAEAWLWKAAEAGNRDAQAQLGALLMQRQETADAEAWFGKAAAAGHTLAQLLVAFASLRRDDLEQAEAWFRKAAEAGNDTGQIQLGMLLLQRHAIAEAECWFRKAAEAGNQAGEFGFGMLLQLRGEFHEAECWLRKTAEAGIHDAQAQLGALLQRRGKLNEAETWSRKAAEAGNQDAQILLARLLMQREATDEAEGWARKAAEAGNHDAELLLGGLLLLREALQEADEWLRKAAELDNHLAEYVLALSLELRDEPEEAQAWARKAAEAGNQEAEKLLGRLADKQRPS